MKTDEVIQIIQDVLTRFPEIKIVTLFGSAASGRLKPNSDIDIAVAAQEKLSFDQKFDIMIALTNTLIREIDLIDLQAVAGPILEEALCTGIVIKKTDLFAKLIQKMWYNQADMMPLTRMIIKKRCQRFVEHE